jgi:hypothetical protein
MLLLDKNEAGRYDQATSTRQNAIAIVHEPQVAKQANSASRSVGTTGRQDSEQGGRQDRHGQADKTNEHGGSSANPPAASLHGERNMIAIKIRPDLNRVTILDGPLLAHRTCLAHGSASSTLLRPTSRFAYGAIEK